MQTEKSLLDLVHRIGQIGAERFSREHGGELTPRQLAVLRTVGATTGASQTAIVSATGIDRSTTSDIVKRLVQKGLLRRRRSRTDARAYVVDLTEAGEAAINSALPMLTRIETGMLAAVPEAERATFISNLEHILSAPSPTK